MGVPRSHPSRRPRRHARTRTRETRHETERSFALYLLPPPEYPDIPFIEREGLTYGVFPLRIGRSSSLRVSTGIPQNPKAKAIHVIRKFDSDDHHAERNQARTRRPRRSALHNIRGATFTSCPSASHETAASAAHPPPGTPNPDAPTATPHAGKRRAPPRSADSRGAQPAAPAATARTPSPATTGSPSPPAARSGTRGTTTPSAGAATRPRGGGGRAKTAPQEPHPKPLRARERLRGQLLWGGRGRRSWRGSSAGVCLFSGGIRCACKQSSSAWPAASFGRVAALGRGRSPERPRNVLPSKTEDWPAKTAVYRPSLTAGPSGRRFYFRAVLDDGAALEPWEREVLDRCVRLRLRDFGHLFPPPRPGRAVPPAGWESVEPGSFACREVGG